MRLNNLAKFRSKHADSSACKLFASCLQAVCKLFASCCKLFEARL